MNDEDILRKALQEGKVTIDGKDFPIKPVKPETIQLQDPHFESECLGTFSEQHAPSSVLQQGGIGGAGWYMEEIPGPVRVGPEIFLSKPKRRAPWQNEDRPEVALREGIRTALRAGLSAEKIKEIFEHELIFGVMGT